MMSTQQRTVGSDMLPHEYEASKEMLYGIQNGIGPNNNEEEQRDMINGHNVVENDNNDQNGDGSEHDHGVEDHENTDDGSTDDINSYLSGNPVKLFVGQVPRNMEEADLFPIFEQYGPMVDVAIIRDKHTGQHRGCAFITFISKESADACEAAMHNKYTFDGGKRAVQIKPAVKKREFENKVFVGMLPRDVQEETVRELFEPYGEIKGVFLIRSNDGIKRGCAFVNYAERSSVMAAIDGLNGTLAIEGSDRPLIVKVADNKQKTFRHGYQNGMYAEHDTPISHSPQGSYTGNMYYMPPGPSSHIHPHLYPGQVASSNNAASPAGSYSSGGHSLYPPSLHGAGISVPATNNYAYQRVHHYEAASGYADHSRTSQAVNQRPREGPAGANLFIYHLPHDLTDADLATAFNPFGNVISAKVFVDRYSGESKGFGFVSYDSIISAEHAIEQMNGFQIGAKRLKVQHKRVNHRPPMHSYYPAGPSSNMTQNPFHDVPPAIEISGSNMGLDSLYSTGHYAHADIPQPQFFNEDINTLTSQFDSMNTSRNGSGGDHIQYG